MPDIFNDEPTAFSAGVPAVPAGFEDVDHHTLSLESLEAVNQWFHAHRAPPGLLMRSVIEDGATTTPGINNSPAFQTTLLAVAAAGGGVALVPPTPNDSTFEVHETITIPHGVVLRGVENGSRIGPSVQGMTVINFEEGYHRGGVQNLAIQPLVGVQPLIGIDLSGTQYLRIRNVLVNSCDTGIVLSDGVTEEGEDRFAAYNFISEFEIDACRVGFLARQRCNQAAVRDGRIHFARADDGSGIAIDIDGALALAFGQIAVENFDTGVRVRGKTSVSLRDVYYEADLPGTAVPGRWLDVQPDLGSIVRLDNSHVDAGQSTVMAGSLEDAITTDERSHIYFGAKRHHAAAAERNLIENGDFHRADGLSIPRWSTNFAPTVAENLEDYVTAGRSYDLTQTRNANDGLVTSFTVPETTDYVTVMVRYKNISSVSLLFRVASGVNAALFADSLLPAEDEWRVAAITVEVDPSPHPPSEAGVVHVTLTADQSTAGGQIRVDEVWGVVGATAAPPRAHAHRVEYLDQAFNVVTRTALTASQQFPETDLTNQHGLGGSPRGIIGAILRLRGHTDESTGPLRQRVVRPFIIAAGSTWGLNLTVRGLEQDRELILRSTAFNDGIQFIGSDTPPTDYYIDVIGWILPS